MDASEYLSRIGYRGATEPSLDNLKAIHRQHLLAVPFGSLAIHCGERIELALPAVYQKVVVQRRGGFCYELNGLFSWLLQALGYQVQLVSGRVRNAITQQPGPPKDHLLLLVATAGEGGHRRWLCDVGFGNAFRWPLPLEDGHLERQENGLFHLQLAGGEGDWRLRRYPLSCQGPTDEPSATLYLFSTEPRAWCDFGAMCRYHQISTSSIFVCKSFCSLHLPGGLVTYMGHRLIETEFNADGDRKATRELTDEEIPQVLKERFGIVLTNRLIPKDEDILPPEEGP
ncbi:arylamine N-acetyltransferase, pineal gland isozyme NAT-3-like [Hemiscyllium ocellatum]|uniref:arylamine N-acetyltransferase, pineal gland isozyme NAT-3-like n=1 Tax=Hemiscyllium ocellatum TaxID=170820 RepID=UPI002966D57E|nr:arylamine N-acetyltransferase, pineal gland isozyme NAT-3-like [Hemiscyllium ocellatum]XP_060678288.1 arylamine N-acetyltransferase, pineal gland isozyme NAT-3-like [Hemiscyllium ocellatum]